MKASFGKATEANRAQVRSAVQALEAKELVKSFPGQARKAVDHVSFGLAKGTFFCLLGPSGCGKTTLLRMIGGYHGIDAGQISVMGRDLTTAPPEKRNMGMVFQNYALFPHKTARENVAFGLRMRRVTRRTALARADDMLTRMGLTDDEQGRLPRRLSGGQQQRVALARALVVEPDLLLLDEPMANLDRRLREQLRTELKSIQRRTGITAILVTHDQEEALTLADKVGVMENGRLLQLDKPEIVYRRPTNAFVASFLGDANILGIEGFTDQQMSLEGGLTLAFEGPPPAFHKGRLVLRPEDFQLGRSAEDCPTIWRGHIENTSFAGADRILDVTLGQNLRLKVKCRMDTDMALDSEGYIGLGLKRERPWILETAS